MHCSAASKRQRIRVEWTEGILILSIDARASQVNLLRITYLDGGLPLVFSSFILHLQHNKDDLFNFASFFGYSIFLVFYLRWRWRRRGGDDGDVGRRTTRNPMFFKRTLLRRIKTPQKRNEKVTKWWDGVRKRGRENTSNRRVKNDE